MCAILFSACLSLSGVSDASAHRVSVFAWVEGDTVYVESKFSGGRRPIESPVEVYDSRGNRLLEGMTDQNGDFHFKVPRKTTLKVVLSAGMGHRAEWVIPENELGHLDEIADPGEQTEAVAPDLERAGASTRAEASVSSPALIGLSEKEVEAVVDRILDKKLKPIMTMLADMRDDRPSITDIFGGLGYILGLVGLAAYMRYRKNKPFSQVGRR
jgi:nickel transport protein